ncbi:unnamed protein product [Nezara viridula]|uniref:Uncharacterized protein n=1 Tax=Nezara viridula TaxID=85310 RepID=A0A9P0H7D6_NEZVI|nr:unnamed protein product [Nezara viridula]
MTTPPATHYKDLTRLLHLSIHHSSLFLVLRAFLLPDEEVLSILLTPQYLHFACASGPPVQLEPVDLSMKSCLQNSRLSLSPPGN